MNAFTQTHRDFANALLGKPLSQEPVKATISDLIRFVRSRPEGPSNIGWMALHCGCDDAMTLEVAKSYLTRALPRWSKQIENKHWSADPVRKRAGIIILDFIDEFEATAA